ADDKEMKMRFAATIALTLFAVLLPALAQSQEERCGQRFPTDRTTIDLRGVDVQTTLRTLAERFRVSLIVTPEATGVVTVSLYEVPVRDALDALVRTAGLVCVVRDGILVVNSRKETETAREATAKAAQIRLAGEAEARKRQVEELAFADLRARGPLREETIRLSYAEAGEVAKTLQGILGLPPAGTIAPPTPSPGIYAPPPPIDIPSEGQLSQPPAPVLMPGMPLPETMAKGITVSAHKLTNSVFIRHYEADLARIKRLVKEQLDVPLPQVQIAAQMVAIVRNALAVQSRQKPLQSQQGDPGARDAGQGAVAGGAEDGHRGEFDSCHLARLRGAVREPERLRRDAGAVQGRVAQARGDPEGYS